MAREQIALSDSGIANQYQWAGCAAGESVDHAPNGFRFSNICIVWVADSAALQDMIQGRFSRPFISIVMDPHVPSDFPERATDGATDASGSPGNEDCRTIGRFCRSILPGRY